MAPAARSLVTKLAAMTKDVPIKMTSITQLARDGSNYRHWELDFLSYIGFIPDVAEYVKGEKQVTDDYYKQEFAEVFNCVIHWTIDRELSLSLQGIALPFERIEELRKQFSGVSFAARQSSMKELCGMMYDSKATSLDQHVASMRGKRDHLCRIGVRLPDDVFAIILSNSVPQVFPDIASAFESRLLLNENHTILSSDVTKALGAADVVHRRVSAGAEVMKVWTRPRGNRSSTEGRTCFWCDVKGHTIRDCQKKKEHKKSNSSGSGSKHDSKSVKITEVEADAASVGFAPWEDPKEVTVSPINLTVDSSEAVFDTGATHNVFNDRLRFLTLRDTVPIPVKMADGSNGGVIVGMGTVEVESLEGGGPRVLLQHVYLCESLKHSLVSGVAICDDGMQFASSKSGLRITTERGISIYAGRRGRKWLLRVCDTGVSASISESYTLWHKRFGHPSERVLRDMISRQSCVGLPEKLGPTIPCETCADAKSLKTSELGSTLRTVDKPLQLVVADLCGPFQEKSVGGAAYFLQIRDVYSTYVKVYTIQNKYDVTGIVKRFIAESERLTGLKVITWRNDGGGEFLNTELQKHMQDLGITLEKTIRYFHEQAGVVERLNRTIQSIMRCKLFGSDLPKTFWSMAVTSAAYLHNRTSNTNTDGKTPQELFLTIKPQVDNLRVFGSWAFVHVPVEKRKKLDHRAVKCRFVGYLAGSKGWRFWDPTTNFFVELAHAKWLAERGEALREVDNPSRSEPIPDRRSSISKLLNKVECPEEELLKALKISYDLSDSSISESIRKQDCVVKEVMALAAGISQKLPRTYNAAMKDDESELWKKACVQEIDMLRSMGVWEEVRLPAGKRAVSSKWVFNRKCDANGVVTKHKTRFVVQGFDQQEGVDFQEMFAPTARFASLMIMFAMGFKKKWHVRGFEVVSAYPHSPINEEIYVKPPEGFPCASSGMVLRLRRALYGTKQAARCWWKFFSKVLIGIGCAFCASDQSLYVLRYKSDTAILWIHVDDGQICASSLEIVGYIRKALEKSFKLVWQDCVDQIVGIKVEHRTEGLFLSQPHLTRSILSDQGFETSSASTPMVASLQLETAAAGSTPLEASRYLSIIGSLSYLAVGTRPDIAFSVNYLARFSACPQKEHWTAVKHLLRYLSSTIDDGIWFWYGDVNGKLDVYCDANWGGEGSRSTHGYVIFLYGCPVGWASRRQSCVATSTCHAEYMALGTATREVV